MSKFNSTSLIVDDRDSSITYSSGWLKVSTTAEYDGTKSGANEAGMTATFVFTGTGVEVYGSQGSYDVYGVPVTSYEIDGFPDTRTEYTAPIIEPGGFTSRTLFYRSAILEPAEHTLVITNINGTQPSLYWLDYLVYTPVNITLALQSSSSVAATSSSPTSSSTNSALSSQTTSSVSSAPSRSNTALSAVKSTKSHTGAIVGGVVGGVVLLAAVVFLLFYRKRRGNSRAYGSGDVDPFGSWPAAVRVRRPFKSPSEKLGSNPATPLPEDSQISSPSGPSGVVDGSGPLQQPIMTYEQASASAVRLHQDSGYRLPPGKVVDIPPAYTDD